MLCPLPDFGSLFFLYRCKLRGLLTPEGDFIFGLSVLPSTQNAESCCALERNAETLYSLNLVSHGVAQIL